MNDDFYSFETACLPEVMRMDYGWGYVLDTLVALRDEENQ